MLALLASRPSKTRFRPSLAYTVPTKPQQPLTNPANSCREYQVICRSPSRHCVGLAHPPSLRSRKSERESSRGQSPAITKRETDRADLHRNNNSVSLAETYQFAESPKTDQRPAFDNLQLINHLCAASRQAGDALAPGSETQRQPAQHKTLQQGPSRQPDQFVHLIC